MIFYPAPQKHHDALFAPSPSASPALLAQTGIFLAQRYLSSASKSGSPSLWSSPALAGFRVGGNSSYAHTVTLSEASSDRTATVSIGASSSTPDNSLPIHVVDFEGVSTRYDGVRPEAVYGKDGGASIMALLGEQLSHVDIVAHGETGVGKETLSLFGTTEEWVGELVVKGPKWLDEVRGEKKVAKGSATAPMREFLRGFLLLLQKNCGVLTGLTRLQLQGSSRSL